MSRSDIKNKEAVALMTVLGSPHQSMINCTNDRAGYHT